MTFPGPGAQIYRNEAGEVLGWDYPSDDSPEMLSCDEARLDAWSEMMWEEVEESTVIADEYREEFGGWWWKRRNRFDRLEVAYEVFITEKETT